MDLAVRTEGLTRRFGDVVAVDALDLEVRSGEVYGLLGLNGAGKTTTVRMLAGLLEPTDGQAAIVDLSPVDERAEIARATGVVYGEDETPEPRFTPARYMRWFGRMHGMDTPAIEKRSRRLFETLEFAEYAQRPIGELSTGNKRKTEIARAVLHEPRVLFLDEPTRGLDIPSKRTLWAFLERFVNDEQRTVFLSSHDTEEIATLCDRIGILRKGKKTWEGAPEDLEREDAGLSEALSDRLRGEQTTFTPTSA